MSENFDVNSMRSWSKNCCVIRKLLATPTTAGDGEVVLLDIIERIVDFLKSYDKDEDTTPQEESDIDVKELLGIIADKFGITERQALIFCTCMGAGGRRISMDLLAYSLGINTIRVLTLDKDLQELLSRRLLRKVNARDENEFYIPAAVVKALKNNEVYVMPRWQGLNCVQFFETLNACFAELNDEVVSVEELTGDIEGLLNDNRQVDFASKVQSLHLDARDKLLLLFFCNRIVNFDDSRILFNEIEGLYTSRSSFFRNKELLRNGKHPLCQLGLIEFECDNGMVDTSLLRLTDEAKTNLLAELGLKPKKPVMNDVMKADTLKQKEMFYTAGNQRQVDELTDFFDHDKYCQIRERMQKRGFRCGFACLFYGSPGTGKTETAYQLARQTGRDIMVVDVPKIKSKWVGDSEKNIKALFDRYRKLAAASEVAPILLFNEADAIINTRRSNAESAVDKMENAIQNIILQEMEQLDGIMIATTNLEGNFDPAFERRFLYKIRFEKPDAAVRAKIWQMMVPELTEEDACSLAARYDFSGGQIENIARKNTINSILYGNSEQLLSVLSGYCENERLSGPAHRRIGF